MVYTYILCLILRVTAVYLSAVREDPRVKIIVFVEVGVADLSRSSGRMGGYLNIYYTQ